MATVVNAFRCCQKVSDLYRVRARTASAQNDEQILRSGGQHPNFEAAGFPMESGAGP
jgi:hypothetical protein